LYKENLMPQVNHYQRNW